MSSPSSEALEAVLGDDLEYSHPDTSFSPFYSDIGLGFDGDGGIASLYFHYNRNTTRFGSPFLPIEGQPSRNLRGVTGVEQISGGVRMKTAFIARNTWIVEVEGLPELTWSFRGHEKLTEARREILSPGVFLYRGFLPSIDARVPDPDFPFAIGMRLLECAGASGDGVNEAIRIAARDGRVRLAFCARAEEVEAAYFKTQLDAADARYHEARDLTRAWLARSLGPFPLTPATNAENKKRARAVFGLLSNACEAPGLLAGRVASFPSRGKYPTHFLWDSCFQNLALERMEDRLAEDALLLLTETLRPDGKMAHFLCSTWVRPHDSQPPLVGWAGLRLVLARNDRALAAKLLPALERNNRWWLAHRGTRFGLISTLSGLETGWDDSPRFDKGPTVACDMNSYLLMQWRACADLARLLGNLAESARYADEADAFSKRMVEVLYDAEANLFFDRHLASGEPVRLRTPACFLPLLAGVPLPEGETRSMIRDTLLSPSHFYGAVPFPSVGYSEACYQEAQWWRGPTWPPVAYFMIQVLDLHGFSAEALASRKTLLDLILSAGDLRELFNSKTGEGLGAKEQGWTAAIFLKLQEELGRTASP